MVNSVNDAVADAAAVLAAVQERGLLFLSDPKRRNAIEVLTGECPHGSWWGHPAANEIYAQLQRVETDPDLVTAKLLSGKVTFVHRALWPELLAVVTAREPWQVEGLPPLVAEWVAAMDEARLAGKEVAQPSRTVAKDIEARLLARGESVHTGTGTHQTRLEDWATWAKRVNCQPSPRPVAEARETLEAAALRLGDPAPTFPWRP
jgi:hypothetical protein